MVATLESAEVRRADSPGRQGTRCMARRRCRRVRRVPRCQTCVGPTRRAGGVGAAAKGLPVPSGLDNGRLGVPTIGLTAPAPPAVGASC